MQGSIAQFGRYTVNEADKTITFHIEANTILNWKGPNRNGRSRLRETN